MREYLDLFKKAAVEFYKDGAVGHSAAVSFYVVLALPAFVLIILSVAGLFLNEAGIYDQLLKSISSVTGLGNTQIIEQLLNSAFDFNFGIGAVYSIVLLFVASSAIFTYLQQSLNDIFGVKLIKEKFVKKLLFQRLGSFLVLVVLSLVFVINIILQWVVSFGFSYLEPLLYFSESVFAVMSAVIGLVVLFALFFLVLTILPRAELSLKDAAVGALLTTFLFSIGNYIIDWYVSRSNLNTAYGAAGSLVILLLWVYYSALIVFYGAEFTKVYSLQLGDGLSTKEGARFSN